MEIMWINQDFKFQPSIILSISNEKKVQFLYHPVFTTTVSLLDANCQGREDKCEWERESAII